MVRNIAFVMISACYGILCGCPASNHSFGLGKGPTGEDGGQNGKQTEGKSGASLETGIPFEDRKPGVNMTAWLGKNIENAERTFYVRIENESSATKPFWFLVLKNGMPPYSLHFKNLSTGDLLNTPDPGWHVFEELGHSERPRKKTGVPLGPGKSIVLGVNVENEFAKLSPGTYEVRFAIWLPERIPLKNEGKWEIKID